MSILMIVLTVIGAWLLVSIALELLIGRAVKLADRDHRRKMTSRSTATRPAARARAIA